MGRTRKRSTAAGQLVFLQRQKQDLEARMAELERSDNGGGATTAQWFKEDWMLLMQRLDAFIDGR